MKKKYFKKRNGEFYLQKTKSEILDVFLFNSPSTYLNFLKEMDYPWIPNIWESLYQRYGENPILFSKYIGQVNLCAYKPFSWRDTRRFLDLYKKI